MFADKNNLIILVRKLEQDLMELQLAINNCELVATDKRCLLFRLKPRFNRNGSIPRQVFNLIADQIHTTKKISDIYLKIK